MFLHDLTTINIPLFLSVSADFDDCKFLLPDSPERCWIFFSDVTVRQTWSGAQQTCNERGGRLLTDPDDSLKFALKKEIKTYNSNFMWWIAVRKRLDFHWTREDGSGIYSNYTQTE